MIVAGTSCAELAHMKSTRVTCAGCTRAEVSIQAYFIANNAGRVGAQSAGALHVHHAQQYQQAGSIGRFLRGSAGVGLSTPAVNIEMRCTSSMHSTFTQPYQERENERKRERERGGEIERERDRQTDIQTDRQR